MNTSSNNKNNKHTLFVLPDAFKIELEALEYSKNKKLGDSKKTMENVLLLLSTLYYKTLKHKDSDGFFPFHSKRWHLHIKNKGIAANVKRILIENGFVTLKGKAYEVGKSAKHYKIHARLMQETWKTEDKEIDAKYTKSIVKSENENKYNGEIKDLTIDLPALYDFLPTLPIQDQILIKGDLNNFHGKYDLRDHGRLYGPFNNCKAELRQFFLLKGIKTHELDIKGSHFWFLAQLTGDSQINYKDFAECIEDEKEKPLAKEYLIAFLHGGGKRFKRPVIYKWLNDKGYNKTVDYIKSHRQKHGYKALGQIITKLEAAMITDYCVENNLPCIHDGLIVPCTKIKTHLKAIRTRFVNTYGSAPDMTIDEVPIREWLADNKGEKPEPKQAIIEEPIKQPEQQVTIEKEPNMKEQEINYSLRLLRTLKPKVQNIAEAIAVCHILYTENKEKIEVAKTKETFRIIEECNLLDGFGHLNTDKFNDWRVKEYSVENMHKIANML